MDGPIPDGNLSEISQKVILYTFFEETPLKSRFRDFFAFEMDKSLVDPYDSTWLKLITILVYVVEVIASMVMVAFVAFETQGLAGHYRTLINQLLSYLYGGVSRYLIQSLLNYLFNRRAWLACMPIAGKVCLLTLIEAKRQTLLAISMHACLPDR